MPVRLNPTVYFIYLPAVDLLPRLVTLHIFAELPGWLQAKVLICTAQRQNAEPLVAAAVADPTIMGYFKLYKVIYSIAYICTII